MRGKRPATLFPYFFSKPIRILGRNPEKSLKNVSPCYLQSLQRLCLEISISSNSLNLLYCSYYSSVTNTVKEKGGKPDRKPYTLPYGIRNPFRNLKSENSQDYAQKPQ
jgi:hypothetical protein